MLSLVVQMSGIGISARKFHLKIPFFKTSHCIGEEFFLTKLKAYCGVLYQVKCVKHLSCRNSGLRGRARAESFPY